MQAKCILCDRVDELDDYSFQAKRLRNKRISVYMCEECNQRITNKTNKRHLSGRFHLYESIDKDDEYI